VLGITNYLVIIWNSLGMEGDMPLIMYGEYLQSFGKEFY
jgi:hypothetical protein